MSEIKTEVVQIAMEHPLEGLFDIVPGSTMVDQLVLAEEQPVQEASAAIVYDEKDAEIDNQFQQVFNAAYMTFEAQRMSTEGMNPQFQARALEVAQQFLTTALAAASEKAKLKAAKDKIKAASLVAGPSHVTNNNTVVMGRNEMLRQLMEQAKDDPAKTVDM